MRGEPSARAVIDILKRNTDRAAALVASMDRVMPALEGEVHHLGIEHDGQLALGFVASVAATLAGLIAANVGEDRTVVTEALIEILREDGGLVVPAQKAAR